MPSGITLAVLREEIMTCACVTTQARVHISVCGTQDRQDKTRQGVETTKTGGLHPGKVPQESRFGPSGLRDGHFSVSDLLKAGWVGGSAPPAPPSTARYGVLRGRWGRSEGWKPPKLGGCT